MKLLQLPTGEIINLDLVSSITKSAGAFNFNQPSNPIATLTYTTSRPSNFITQLVTFINSSDTILQLTADAPVVLGSVSPSPFNLATDEVVITGSGFYPEMEVPITLTATTFDNVIYVEDPAGGTDSNNTCLKITYVSPTIIKARFYNAGAGLTAAGTNLFYFLSNGVLSNVLNVPTT